MMRHYVPTFKMKPLTAAIIAANGSLGVSGAANAVHLNPDGLRQVRLYPYYTTKEVKVRFLEGKNSREVIDFNLFLSPQDVWTGAIVSPLPDTVGEVPMAISIANDTGGIDTYARAVDMSRTPLPLVVLASPREETKIPSNQELLDLIGEKPLEGYFPT